MNEPKKIDPAPQIRMTTSEVLLRQMISVFPPEELTDAIGYLETIKAQAFAEGVESTASKE